MNKKIINIKKYIMNNSQPKKPKSKWIIVKIIASLAALWILLTALIPLLGLLTNK